MSINKKRMVELLDSLNIDYELDSANPGIETFEGEHLNFSDLRLPGEYLKNIENVKNKNIEKFIEIKIENAINSEYEDDTSDYMSDDFGSPIFKFSMVGAV
ncbi:hypothetical protein [Lactococcus lactis]|uniref:hypothetical protein n=1 Tax=Lactococcus lactis TaxID=1358 RepID=UPI0024A8A835|nr:hypothetical protein [Lactococcus lactis]